MEATVEHTDLTESSHRNVTIYLYDENESVVASKWLGTVDESASVRVKMNATEAPEYIVVNSPEFWTYDTISVNYYERTERAEQSNGVYSSSTIGSKEEFPVTVPPNASAHSRFEERDQSNGV
ncbi:hypothetical protein [Halosimplex halobium]|uniref:hypothetical protein n=1 Tax=Halosimplex halobium TaxID=3396618 RepID=UPI003F5508F6